LQFF
jgi:hypothetical protein